MTATIGPCQAMSGCNTTQYGLLLEVVGKTNINAGPDGAFSYTLLNQTVSGAGTQFSHFNLSGPGNYEITSTMNLAELTFFARSGGSAQIDAFHVLEGPQPELICNNNIQLRFRSVQGVSRTLRFVVAMRAGAPKCPAFSNAVPPLPPVSTSTADLNALWVENPADVYAVGARGTILHFDGLAWRDQASNTQADLYGLCKGTTMMAFGAGGVMLALNGTTWSSMTTPATGAIFGCSDPIPRGSTSTFAVGAAGMILFFDGTWRRHDSGTSADLFGVGGRTLQSVTAAGANGTVLRFDGTRWLRIPVNTTDTLRGGTGDERLVFLVGDRGTLLKSTDAAATFTVGKAGTTTANLYSADSDSTAIWIAGDNGTVMRSRDGGQSWFTFAIDTTANFRSIDGGGGFQWVAGTGGAIFRYDGTSFTRQR